MKIRKFFPLILLLFGVTFALHAKTKAIYKMMILDYRGNRRVLYTSMDAKTYVTNHGGPAIIKGIRVLDQWKVETKESLHGKLLVALAPKNPKVPLKPTDPSIKTPTAPDQPIAKTEVKTVKSPTIALADQDLKNQPKVKTIALSPKIEKKHATEISKIETPNPIAKKITSEKKDQPIIAKNGDSKAKPQPEKEHVDLPVDEKSSKIELDKTIIRRLGYYDKIIAQAAKKHKLDPDLLRALVYVESAGNYRAISPKKAMGLTQLTRTTAKSLGVRNVFDPRQNLFGGAKYLKQMIDRFGDERTALAAYNAGPTRVAKNSSSLPTETINHIKKVLAVRDALGSK